MTPWSYLPATLSNAHYRDIEIDPTYPKSVKPVPVTKAIAAVSLCPRKESLCDSTSAKNLEGESKVPGSVSPDPASLAWRVLADFSFRSISETAERRGGLVDELLHLESGHLLYER